MRSLRPAVRAGLIRWRRTAGLALVGMLCLAFPAWAQEQDPDAVLKAMSDYMAKQSNVTVTFDSDIEIITPEIEKIQFTNSGEVQFSRPDKLRAHRAGGYADVELVFDGKTVSVLGKHLNAYASADAPGTIDQLVDRLRHEVGVELPAGDLLLSNSYEALTADVIESKYVGHGVVDGVEAHHLAFRGAETDWQIWVEIGDRPIPRKYVITSKTVAAAPQYTLRIKSWKNEAPSAYAFAPPEGAKKVEFKELSGIDELPESHVEGKAE